MLKKSLIILIGICVVASLVLAWAVFVKPEPVSPVPPPPPPVNGDIPKIDTSDWKTYRNEEFGFEVECPLILKDGVNKSDVSYKDSISKSITIKSIEDIKKEYEEWKNKGGCPGTCSILSANKDILEKQFKILDKAKNCPYSENYIEEIKNDFILFHDNAGGIQKVESIYNNNLRKCGMKLIDTDGYSLELTIYYYKVGFLIDEKVIEFKFYLFPFDTFKEVDQLWKSFGYKNGSCDSHCCSNEADYIDNMDFDDPLIKKMIERYDRIVSSFRFIE